MAVLSPRWWLRGKSQKEHVLMAVPCLGLGGRKGTLSQIHPKAPSDASVGNIPLLYVFEFSVLWRAAQSCWEARNNITPRTVNTPTPSSLSRTPASGRDLYLPGPSQRRAGLFLPLPQVPETAYKAACHSGARPPENSSPPIQRKVTDEANVVGSPVPWNKHASHLECHVRGCAVDSGRNAAAFALSQLGGPLGNHGTPSVSSLA